MGNKREFPGVLECFYVVWPARGYDTRASSPRQHCGESTSAVEAPGQ
jgi:hypothetical protein